MSGFGLDFGKNTKGGFGSTTPGNAAVLKRRTNLLYIYIWPVDEKMTKTTGSGKETNCLRCKFSNGMVCDFQAKLDENYLNV